MLTYCWHRRLFWPSFDTETLCHVCSSCPWSESDHQTETQHRILSSCPCYDRCASPPSMLTNADITLTKSWQDLARESLGHLLWSCPCSSRNAFFNVDKMLTSRWQMLTGPGSERIILCSNSPFSERSASLSLVKLPLMRQKRTTVSYEIALG